MCRVSFRFQLNISNEMTILTGKENGESFAFLSRTTCHGAAKRALQRR